MREEKLLILCAPVFAFLELTPFCNNCCPGCGNVFISRAGENTPVEESSLPLSARQWREVLDKLHPYVFSVRLTGGEPTLHPEFDEIVTSVAERNISFSVFTNARWAQPEKIISLLRRAPGFASLLVSLHGADPASHDTFTGVPGSFQETTANIRQATSAGLIVYISTIITSLNYDRVPEVIELALGLGAKAVVFNRFVAVHDSPIAPTEEQLITAIQAVDKAHRAGAPVRFSVCIPQCFYPSSSTGCLAGVAYWTVDPWGSVRPCNHAPLLCGNLLEQSVEEIWNGDAMQRWREMMPSDCFRCAEFSRCHGGCKAMALLSGLNYDPLMREPLTEEKSSPPAKYTLYAGARPLARFRFRPEPFGYILVGHSQVVPVSADAKPVLDACDGNTTLREIQEGFGQSGLNLVGYLYKMGMVELL